MGRFFKTSTPQDIDYMFKLPEELMIRATQQAAEDISSIEQVILSLAGKLELLTAPIEDDRLRAKAIIGQYEDKINSMAQQLQADPLSYRKKSGEVIGLARDIHNEWTKGEAAAISGRYLGYKNTVESFQKQIESGRIKDPQSVPFMIKDLLQRNAKVGYDPVTGGYNTWQDEQLVPYVDIVDKYSGLFKNVKAQILANGGSYSDGKYIHNYEGKTEILTEDDLAQRAAMLLFGDSETQDYLLQRGRIGALQGYTTTDEFGNTVLIEPGQVVGEGENRRYKFDPSTKLGALMSGVTSLFTVNNVLEQKSSMSADPYGVQADAQIKAATPDSFNTPLSVKATLPTAESYHNNDTKTQIQNTVASAYSVILAGIERKKLGSTALKAEMDKLTEAVNKAKSGDATDLAELYKTLPGDLKNDTITQWLGSYNNVYSSGNITDYQYNAMKEMVLPSILKSFIGTPEAKKAHWDKLPEAKKQEYYDREINKHLSEISNQTVDIQATSGNNSDLWATPELRQAAIKHLKPAIEFMKDPGNWGSKFYYSYPEIDSEGNQVIDARTKKPKYITEEATLVSQDVSGKFTYTTSKGIQINVAGGQVTTDDEGEGSTGKMKNPISTPQLVPYTTNFGYTGLDGTPQQSTGTWMFKIPVMGTTPVIDKGNKGGKAMQGYVFIDGSSVNSPEIQALKDYAEPNRRMLSLKKSTEVSLDALDQLSQKLGVPYNKDVNLSFPGGLKFNVRNRHFTK